MKQKRRWLAPVGVVCLPFRSGGSVPWSLAPRFGAQGVGGVAPGGPDGGAGVGAGAGMGGP